jgi:hypothetical protein
MKRRFALTAFAGILGLWLWVGHATPAPAQDTTMSRYFYYPYYYFPHNYWPQYGPRWPEPANAPYMRPPAYMSFPPFQEPHWRYEYWKPQLYYSGFHFWLDVF